MPRLSWTPACAGVTEETGRSFCQTLLRTSSYATMIVPLPSCRTPEIVEITRG